tara:strand:+ start:6822 stop:7985 length:1164 start_codon:yes stop_codon:yes gene_type:complete
MSRSTALQDAFNRSVAKARSRGIDTRTLAQKTAALEAQQKKIKEQAKGSDDGRSSSLLKQFSKSLQPTIDRNKFLMDQEKRRADILAGRIIPKRSDFTGFEGGVLGIRTGDFTDTGLPKIREGLTSADYADFMKKLYQANPKMMETMFPVASGALARQVFTPAPLKILGSMATDTTQDVVAGLKKIAQDKGIIPKDQLNTDTRTTADVGSNSAGLTAYAPSMFDPTTSDFRQNMAGTEPYNPTFEQGITSLPFDEVIRRNLLESQGIDRRLDQLMNDFKFRSTPENVFPENMFPETVTAPRRLTATDPSAAALMQQIMNKPINMVDGRDIVGDLQPMYGINAIAMNPEQFVLDNPPEIKTGLFNEGGLASINNPDYNYLMRSSNFDV